MADLDLIFKAYDIRGIYPDHIDADVCRKIGSAFARLTRASRVLVARDMRPSGEELVAAFAEGVNRQGVDVVDLGLASTDLLYFAAGKLDAPGAMFTASHNPAQYQGIKLCREGAAPVGEESGLRDIRAMVESDDAGAAAALPGKITKRDLIGDYAEHIRSFIDSAALGSATRLSVIADVANGMGGLVVPAAFEGLPADLELMYPELDGTFPNHPADPTVLENLSDLRKRVVQQGADMGLGFDGDADRAVVVDETGSVLSGSTVTCMLAELLLRNAPGAAVVYNLICSRAVPEVIAECGGEPIRSRVGHSFIKQVMAETNAVFGGEHSAHYYFRDNYRADSGLITSVLVLGLMAETGRPLSELRKPYERYSASGEINTRVSDPQATIERVAAQYANRSQDRLDGLTVDAGSWWFNLRASNTEPLLRLNLEASDQAECETHLAEVLGLVREDEADGT
ncbi:MAG TPA: phosphomannomutase/phosphoglucomutase [Acidimicrobiales bacterium]|nr:phosphomannomutase/phosphoglucomutase [Acidimicrobiales bacterium]